MAQKARIAPTLCLAAGFMVVGFMLAGCDRAPAPTRASAGPAEFTLLSEQADPAQSSLVVNIKLAGPATESDMKTIAEAVIADRKGHYANITVKSFLGNAGAGDTPYAVSTLAGGAITHRFNPQPETKRIPTH